MKLLKALCLTLCLASTALHAMDYRDSDLLLIFRADGFNDLEFNLGSVSNFLGKNSGTKINVHGFDQMVLLDTYGSLEGVKYVLLATTGSPQFLPSSGYRNWLTGVPDQTATDVTTSRLGQQLGLISRVGNNALLNAPPALAYFSVPPSDPASYSDSASNPDASGIPSLGSAALFDVERDIPGELNFYQLKAFNGSPKPAALFVGVFEMDVDGNLTFTAGNPVTDPPQRPRITNIQRVGSTVSLSVTSETGVNYRLRYAGSLASGGFANWTAGTDVIPGNGGTITINDTSAEGTRFYVVEAFR
jgi:hypothetical protein